MNNFKLKKLQTLVNKGQVETPDKEFYTARQLGRMWNINSRTASTRIQRCIEAGIIEVKNFRIKSGMVTRPIPHYKIYEAPRK